MYEAVDAGTITADHAPWLVVSYVTWTVGEYTVPAGSQLAILYGSANRDERRWSQPERFDVRRDNTGQLAFGYGLHVWAGR